MTFQEKIMMYFISKVPQMTGQKEIFGDKTIEPGIEQVCREAAAEGIVLLKNDGTLPFKKENCVSVFGRVQVNYFHVGYGSGGDVATPYKVNLLEGMRANPSLTINENLAKVYEDWCQENPVDDGVWGLWPRYYEEMPLTAELVSLAKTQSDMALVVIGRAAGEDRENSLKPGSFFLTKDEEAMLDAVTSVFEKTVVILDTGNIMDMSWMERYGDKISALVLAWQGGMESGNALADILSGAVTPSGKLTDTIAYQYNSYPSAKNFGGKRFNNYAEDIFVGYRYFETFNQKAVQFPFGYGLSYTTFDQELLSWNEEAGRIHLQVKVTNSGDSYPGAEIIQLYVDAPQGKLGKAKRSLVAFAKTGILAPGASEELVLTVNVNDMASFDDSGKTGYKDAFVLEAGDYSFYLGANVRDAKKVGVHFEEATRLVAQMSEAMGIAPKHAFKRMVAAMGRKGQLTISKEKTPVRTESLRERILTNLPQAIPMTGDQGIKLMDVKEGKASLEDFVAQLSPEELEALSRGEGSMGSALGSKGNAGAFGGVTEALRQKGITPVITTDGPAGIRLQYYASQLPCGTALASTWNLALVEKLGAYVGRELIMKGSDVLLSPGMNIHRDPLCGRNFEYYSEDPYLTGFMAAAMVKGIQAAGGSACAKHFACNNQETNRNRNDSRVSPRALREIYLKGFEICIKEAAPKNIMTSYNKVNGVWSHYNYDLCTTILRKEWGYQGNIVTDWWMQNAKDPDFPALTNNAYRVRAQVDVLMPGSKSVFKQPMGDDSYLKSYHKEDGITLGEMQRSAMNTLRFVMDSYHFNHQA